MSKTNASEQTETESVLDGAKVDPLLECLVFLTAHFGRSKSAESLKAGLPYDTKGMGPNLFCSAAELLGLKTQIVKREALDKIPEAVLPAVLILNGEQACVLLSRSKGEGTARIFVPDTGEAKDVTLEALLQDYVGYAIFIHPRSEFTNPDSVHTQDNNRHWFWGLIEENRSTYVMVMLAAVFINVFGLVSPLFTMNVYDRVIPNNAIETGWALGIGALTVFAFDLTMRILRGYLIDLAGRRIDVIAAKRIYDQVMNMKYSERPKSSGVFANMLRDFDTVRDFFTSATITGFVDMPFALLFLFVIFLIAGPVALVLVGLMALVLVIGYALQFPLKALVRKSTQSAEAKHGLLVESIHGLETIKSIGADGRFRARYGDFIAENAAYGQQSRLVSGLGVNIANFLQQISSVVIVLIGMYMVQEGDISMGALIATVMMGGRAIAPIGQIANLMTRYHSASSSLKTLEGLMAKPVERPPAKQFLHRPDLKGKIAFEGVQFSYPGVDRKVLTDVGFTILPGEKVGVIGRVGSGKTTIAKLIMGLYEPGEGALYMDGTDYRQIDPADIRRHVSYVSQDIFLFSGSVRDNITASLPQATDAMILEAAVKAGVHEFIARHPMGYDAPVGEHGAGLSGGQRQAIALARAMLIKPKVMVFDEPTNAMDSQAEANFMSYVKKDINERTLILITHKQSMLGLVDRLILIDQGRVVSDGPRDEVIKALAEGKIEVARS
jgi:ATP-binding cassette subfamily C protein LapB